MSEHNKSSKLTEDELKQARYLWDIIHNPTRQLATMQTPESIQEGWNRYIGELCAKYGHDQMKTSVDLQSGYLNEP